MVRESREIRNTFWALCITFALLIAIGTANVFSATFVEDYVTGGNSFSHLFQQGRLLAIGAVFSGVVYRIKYQRLQKYAWIGILIAVVLLVGVLFAGTVVNGARRWIIVMGISFQPSEVAKLAGILSAASYISLSLEKHRPVAFFPWLHHGSNKTGWWKGLCPHKALIGPLIMALLVFKQPDAGTAIIIFSIPCLMLWIGGARLSQIKWLVGILACIAAVGIVMEPYRMNRIIAWLDPWGYSKTLGYQTVQGLITIGSGGIFGQGVGEGISKFNYLPEAHTDFAFAVVAQEWGLCGSIFILILFSAILYFGAMTARYCQDRFNMFLAIGITLYLGGQGLVNICMVSGMVPVVGIPLPFISYGGTALVVNMVAAAVLLKICRSNQKQAMQREIENMAVTVTSMKEETRSQFPLKPQ